MKRPVEDRTRIAVAAEIELIATFLLAMQQNDMFDGFFPKKHGECMRIDGNGCCMDIPW